MGCVNPGSELARLTHAAHAGGVELKVVRTVAEVAARRVHTQPVDAVHRVGAFVDVCSHTHTHTREVRKAANTHVF